MSVTRRHPDGRSPPAKPSRARHQVTEAGVFFFPARKNFHHNPKIERRHTHGIF